MKSDHFTSDPVITAAIYTYNRYDVLPKAIDSLLPQTLPKGRYRIFVVDNSPDADKAAEWQKKYAKEPAITYWLEPVPGLSNARNVAARECGTPFISFMDDDAIASPGWLEKVLEAFVAYGDEAGVVGGRVDPIWSKPRPPWMSDKLLGHVSVVNWGGELRVADPAEWFAGTNISFRTEDILKFGGFSTNLGRIGSGSSLLSNEEIRLVDQIRGSGRSMIYAPDAKVDHLVEEARLGKSWFRKRMAWQAASDFIMDPQAAVAKTAQHWEGMVDYYNAVPPEYRTLRALFFDTDDAGMFDWQLGALYMATQLNLAGYGGIED